MKNTKTIQNKNENDNKYYIKKAQKDCEEAKGTKAYCENEDNKENYINIATEYDSRCTNSTTTYQKIINDNC